MIFILNFTQIPMVRSGTAKVEIKFSEPTPASPLQSMYWAAMYPTILAINHDRKITTSFKTS